MGVSGPERRQGVGRGYKSLRRGGREVPMPWAWPVLYMLLINATRNPQCGDVGLEFIALFNVPLLYLASEIHGHSFVLFL